jgi:uncharacterized membrane protein
VSFWILIQVILNLVLIAGIAGTWFRLKRPAPTDPRMSKGLQLLQTKISVIEDLSDRTETQVNQVTTLLEAKVKEVQTLLIEAERMNRTIEASMQRSLEVAKIFQDRIPHQEILERQNTIKYVKAARMAHQGSTVEEIAEQVDLSRGEIEFIAKVNKNQLQFSEENLPDWAKNSDGENIHAQDFVNNNMSTMTTQMAPVPTVQVVSAQPLAKKEDQVAGQVTLNALGDKFRQATVIGVPAGASPQVSSYVPPVVMAPPPPPMRPTPPPTFMAQNSKGQDVQVRKVVFPKVDPNSNLA